jgi:hypothetical protein
LTLNEAEDLRLAVERLHGCSATYRSSRAVSLEFKGQPAWIGSVSVFEVGHPEAEICFAWSAAVVGSETRRYYAILKKPPIDTAADAVRASIDADYKGGR